MRPVQGGFNGGGYADLVLDNLSNQTHRVWTMGGSVRESTPLVSPDTRPPASWSSGSWTPSG